MPSRSAWLAYPLLALVVVIAPPMMEFGSLPTVQSSYGGEHRILEILGLSATAALAVVVWRESAKRRGTGLVGAIPVILFALVTMQFVMLVSEYGQRMPDYACYENAAKQIDAGRSPYYAVGYMYPPLTAQALSVTHRAIVRGLGLGEARGWDLVFYLWQCAQLFLGVAAYLLSVRFARALGAGGLAGLALVAAAFVFNGPLVRTFRFDQPNLWMLDAILFALAFGSRHAAVTGALLGLAACVKMYPAALLLPMALTRRWKMLAGFALAVGAAVLIGTGFGSDTTAWSGFARFARVFPYGDSFRDNGLYSVVSRTVWFAGEALGLSGGLTSVISAALWRVAVAAAGVWIALRIVRREQSFAALGRQERDSETATMLRFTGHTVDAIAFALMAAPIVWEHHYVLAVPIVLWAIVTQRSRRPWLIAVGSALMLLPPSFDVYPFGYHRIAGLLMVLAGTSPRVDLAEYERNTRAWQTEMNWITGTGGGS